MEHLSNIEQEGGSNQSPSFTKEKTKFQCKQYFFTYHINASCSFEQAFTLLEQLVPHCSKYVWGEEYGKSSDTPHIQGAFILHKKQRADYIQKHFFEFPVHLVRLKDWQASLDYCQKECNKIVTNSLPYVCEIQKLYDWQQDVLDILKDNPDDRSIHWIFDYRGCKGKTTLCKYIFTHYKGVIVTGGRESDMFNGIVKYQELNGSLPKIVLIDIPRSKENFVSWSGIEKIKDMFFYSGKYEGGMVCGESPHVICFSNFDAPKHEISNDRWNIQELGTQSE